MNIFLIHIYCIIYFHFSACVSKFTPSEVHVKSLSLSLPLPPTTLMHARTHTHTCLMTINNKLCLFL